MKSTVSNTPCSTKSPYPKLMQLIGGSHPIVFFHKEQHGICVHKGEGNTKVGDYSSSWLPEKDWEDFTGSICLEND